MELTGTLDCFPLRELLELMQDSSMCGVVEIAGQWGVGRVGAKDGLICHAEYAGKIGHAALWLLFEETSAAFTVRSDTSRLTRQTLIGDASMLSDEGEERASLWRPIRQRIPDLNLVPVGQPAAQNLGSLEHVDTTVFVAIDGLRTISEIAEAICLEVLDVCRALIRLMDAHIVQLTSATLTATRATNIEPGPIADSLRKRSGPMLSAKETSGGLFRRPMGAETAVAAPTGLLGRLLQS